MLHMFRYIVVTEKYELISYFISSIFIEFRYSCFYYTKLYTFIYIIISIECMYACMYTEKHETYNNYFIFSQMNIVPVIQINNSKKLFFFRFVIRMYCRLSV